MRNTFLGFLLATLMFIVGILIVQNSQKKLSPVGEIEILAITEDGTKIYRVNHPKAIVPPLVVESKNGHVAVR